MLTALSYETELNVDDFENIQPSVAQEFADLKELGFRISLDDTNSPELLDPHEQMLVDDRIQEWEAIAESEGPDAAFEAFTSLPALAQWAVLRKRAVALHTLYNASEIKTLGEGIDTGSFRRPLFEDGKSAFDLLVESKKDPVEGLEKAELIERLYTEFIKSAVESDGDKESRNIFKGCLDGRAVNSRAVTAFGMAIDHINENSTHPRNDIRVASLACGAAGRVYSDLVEGLNHSDHKVEKIELVDNDPMALAAAHALADGKPGIQDKLGIHRANLLEPDFLEAIKPESLDMVDMLGIFEYLPSNKAEVAAFMGVDSSELEDGPDYNYAARFLERAGTLVKPGGQMILGNMLNERPQQGFFSDVVQWPQLYQRTMADVLNIINEAGYSMDGVEVKVPANDGVYAVYAITLPEAQSDSDETRYPILSLVS